MSNNQKAAKIFADAIRQLGNDEDRLNNFESYIGQHFDVWLERYARTPEGIADELKTFAEM
jgi:hypothetical protein